MEVWMNHKSWKLKLALSEISVKHFNFLKWNEQNIFVSGSVVGNVASHVSKEETFAWWNKCEILETLFVAKNVNILFS